MPLKLQPPSHVKDSAWALLIAAVALIAVTAFTAGRAFSSSCSLCHHEGGSPPPINISDPRYAARFGHITGSSSIGSTQQAAGVNGSAARYANISEHPACAFFRMGECMCRSCCSPVGSHVT